MASCFCFLLRSKVPIPNYQVQFNHPLESLLQEIENWCRESIGAYGNHFSWDNEQVETFRRYVSHVEVDPLISSRVSEKLHQDEAWGDGHILSFKHQGAVQLVRRIFGELGDLFKVPKLKHQLSHSHMDTRTLSKDQLVAGFINFLLHLLHSHQHFTALTEYPDVVNLVVKELRVLNTIIGDRPFRDTVHKEVKSILVEFELVVNEAGAFVHSLVFSPRIVKKMNKSLEALLKHIQLLKTNISKFLQQLPNIVFTPRLNSSMDSPFILVYLKHDLEDLIDLDDNGTFVELKKLSKSLHQLLLPCQSIFTGTQIDELKNELVLVQIISVAYDAKYLVSAFLDGEIPPSYLTIRLTHLIDNISLYATRLQEMGKDCSLMASKVTDDFRAQPSLQTVKDSLVDDFNVGFEQQEEHILDLLIRGTEKLQEVFIYGMPGIGKTTQARRIYHHPLVSHHFDRRSWCVVSQMHNRKNLLIGILVCITSDSKEEDKMMEMEEGSLELKIYQILKDRRYLMVMDDLWDTDVWDNLRFLPDDHNGSRILFTSRNKDVAPCGGNGITHELPVLSTDQC